MENMLGLLRIHIQRGVNLAVRDMRSSDPYLIVKMGKQKLKTRVVKKSLNPEWNEQLTLSIVDPDLPILVSVYDKDTFSFDDKMGDAQFEIGPFFKAMKTGFQGLQDQDGAIISKVQVNKQNCLAEESCIIYSKGKLVQNMVLRLRNVECGEVELQLQWIDIPSSKGRP
ncbi:PREDICTED: probable ADP-ribosylation factor GTPase-activating protein AGD11 [Fragaria vesca subsp. vesca]|uniref:probable ADP-ribosylation factor GTPase-activating protein AGD11 n=1 Tax=Fragaria vesca subsp. vesca TaxID=101020 RepID=UPI0002C30F23|nr:PREDICTED: probable ADP-ribosylation factor GTPase-activating protein AGD11 [Fragaria vesca subsp. vesca]